MLSTFSTPLKTGFATQPNALRKDAYGASMLRAHQQYGAMLMPNNPANGDTWSVVINGSTITGAYVTSIGSVAGNVLRGATAAATAANLQALLRNPQQTTSTGVALAAANQQLCSYVSWSLIVGGTTIVPAAHNLSIYTWVTSFSASFSTSGNTWSAQTMQLFLEDGVAYVNGTRIIFNGASTPTVTAPVSNPRIDVLTIDSSGTLAWTTGAENASPVAPTYPANKMPVLELYNVVGETALYDKDNKITGQGYIYNDVRNMLGLNLNFAAIPAALIPDADGTRDLGSPSFEWGSVYAKNGIFLNGQSINSQLSSAYTALEAISAGAALAIGLTQASLVGYDTSGVTTATGSITIGSNSNRLLLLIVIATGSAGVATNVSGTFAGQALTFTNNDTSPDGINHTTIATAVLVAPTIGSGALSLSASASGTIFKVTYASVYNCVQTSPQDVTAFSAVSSATGISLSATIATDGAFVFGAIVSENGTSSIGTPSGGIYNSNTATTSNPATAIGNNGPSNIYPVGSTLTIANAGGTSTTWAAGIIAVKPLTAPVRGVINASSASILLAVTRCAGFIGFAVNSAIQGASVTVATAGIATGLSGLTLGTQYYLNDSNGTIGKVVGTISRKVGVAVDTTKILITNIW